MGLGARGHDPGFQWGQTSEGRWGVCTATGRNAQVSFKGQAEQLASCLLHTYTHARLHTHKHVQAGPYGFSKDAAPFDAAVGRWADSLRPEELLSEAARRQHGAKSCGFPGMVLLHGMLRRGREAAAAAGDSASSVVGRLLAALTKAPAGAGGQAAGGRMAEAGRAVQGAWHGRLLALHHPTYCGMAVAAFERRGQQAVALQ